MSGHVYSGKSSKLKMPSINLDRQRKIFIGIILILALLAFEMFNFDTTQFAMQSLLGDVKFMGVLWATILAIAFCSIDFAGLVRLFSPEHASGSNKEGWYLMGAWLLGATMNAVMTWWAVSLTLLNNNFGNEVLSREQLLRYVPIFVAVLVWLTRILFIGAFSVAGVQLFESKKRRSKKTSKSNPQTTPSYAGRRKTSSPSRLKAAPKPKPSASSVQSSSMSDSVASTASSESALSTNASTSGASRTSRVRHRPPMPNGGSLRKPGSRIQARRHN